MGCARGLSLGWPLDVEVLARIAPASPIAIAGVGNLEKMLGGFKEMLGGVKSHAGLTV
jgi:hypothetical protein